MVVPQVMAHDMATGEGKTGVEVKYRLKYNGQMGNAPPVDSSDELYKTHDEAYEDVDQSLKQALRDLEEGIKEEATKAHEAAIDAADRSLVQGLFECGFDEVATSSKDSGH
jgi:hypothetical protein